MKDKEKQIEEMAKDLNEYVSYDEWSAREYGEYSVDCDYTAHKLIEQGWIKPNKDSVVLLKTKYEMLVACSSYEGVINKLKDEYIKGSNETAEKIFKELKSKNQYEYFSYDDDKYCVSSDAIEELAKQFGVELEQ